jgi:hypothetical protein
MLATSVGLRPAPAPNPLHSNAICLRQRIRRPLCCRPAAQTPEIAIICVTFYLNDCAKQGLGRHMNFDDYLRDEAQKYRQQADEAEDQVVKQELLELAYVCDQVANDIEDRMTAG